MPRTGEQYLESLDDGRAIYIDGARAAGPRPRAADLGKVPDEILADHQLELPRIVQK